MLAPAYTHHIDEQLTRTLYSAGYRNCLATLTGLEITPRQQEALAAILLIEMTNRTTAERFLEWTLRAVIPPAEATKRLRPWTVGPLQLSDGPLKLTAAIYEACRAIDGCANDNDLRAAMAWIS